MIFIELYGTQWVASRVRQNDDDDDDDMIIIQTRRKQDFDADHESNIIQVTVQNALCCTETEQALLRNRRTVC
jgi:hypothetical protein